VEPLDAAIEALAKPLSGEERFYGWTERSQRDWLAYLDGLRQGIRIPTDPDNAAVLDHLRVWLDRDGINDRSALAELMVTAQRHLHDRFAGSSERVRFP
jgi:hypothetical protein